MRQIAPCSNECDSAQTCLECNGLKEGVKKRRAVLHNASEEVGGSHAYTT